MEPTAGSPGLLELARRLGPRPFSSLAVDAPSPVPVVVAEWEVAAVDRWWVDLGRPDPFTLIEVGAGDGTRPAAFLAGGPECLGALRYVLVEQDAGMRAAQGRFLPIESPILVLGPVGPSDQEDLGDEDELRPAVAGIGPLLTSLAELPVVEGVAIVLAMGWAGRLPSDRLEWREGRWWEVRLAAVDGALSELLVPLDPERAETFEQLVPARDRPEAGRYAQLTGATEWLARSFGVAEVGVVAVVDRWRDRTRPLAAGEVPPLALDQLASLRRPDGGPTVDLSPDLSVVSWRLG